MLDVRKIRLTLELRNWGITDPDVLSVIEKIPREIFVSENCRHQAYENIALPIDREQTISQPYIVALMTQSLDLNKEHKVLEIGTGSGYQTSILSLLSRRIYTIERIKSFLAKRRLPHFGQDDSKDTYSESLLLFQLCEQDEYFIF